MKTEWGSATQHKRSIVPVDSRSRTRCSCAAKDAEIERLRKQLKDALAERYRNEGGGKK